MTKRNISPSVTCKQPVADGFDVRQDLAHAYAATQAAVVNVVEQVQRLDVLRRLLWHIIPSKCTGVSWLCDASTQLICGYVVTRMLVSSAADPADEYR